MRHRRVRCAFVGLILAMPLLMVRLDRRASARAAAVPILLTEAVLAAGLWIAARERPRLLAERVAPALESRGTSATARHVTVGR